VFKDDSTGRKALSPFCQTHNIFCDAIWSSPGFPVPQREAMELMRHNDPRLTANTYADVSLLSLRGAVAKLSFPSAKHDAQIHAQTLVPDWLLRSLPVTVAKRSGSDNIPVNTRGKSLSDTLCRAGSKTEEWRPRKDLNLNLSLPDVRG
jgi:hypothetical protein